MPAVQTGSLNKEESIQFHIRSNDYFGTLATEIDLLRQDTQRRGYTQKHDVALRRLRDDLVYLQRGFCITRRSLEGAPSNVPPVQKIP